MTGLPSVAQMRPVTQPDTVTGRASAEHWTGTLYMRRISPYLTRLLIPTSITPNGVTWLMIASGAAAGGALLVPGLPGAVLAVLLTQLQMLLDCVDGELRSEEHTSELQSHVNLVCRLLLEKKNKKNQIDVHTVL